MLAAAVIASVASFGAFRLIAHLPQSVRARQIAGTVDEIVDLSEDIGPGRDHIRGAADAPVTLVEYGDYQCPDCGQGEVVVRELLISFGDDLRYVWPLAAERRASRRPDGRGGSRSGWRPGRSLGDA